MRHLPIVDGAAVIRSALHAPVANFTSRMADDATGCIWPTAGVRSLAGELTSADSVDARATATWQRWELSVPARSGRVVC